MTLQQLKYVIVVAERGSITEVAKELYISQPSLSGAIKEVEKEAGITIFSRCRAGVALTKEGMEFLGYARMVVWQMELLEAKYIDKKPAKQRFCVSTQHYTFTTNAFVNLMIGLDGYTISSGIFPKYLQGESIVSIPLEEEEVMHIGYILNKDKELSELGEIYVEALRQYQKQ